jgi:hypothetical protein
MALTQALSPLENRRPAAVALKYEGVSLTMFACFPDAGGSAVRTLARFGHAPLPPRVQRLFAWMYLTGLTVYNSRDDARSYAPMDIIVALSTHSPSKQAYVTLDSAGHLLLAFVPSRRVKRL